MTNLNAVNLSDRFFDLEKVLPLELIREHTKTDDIPTVTDEQILLYRQAAMEAAERYTGLLFTRQSPITEVVDLSRYVPDPDLIYHDGNRFTHILSHPAATGEVYFYGISNVAPRRLVVRPGSRNVILPYINFAINMNCCDPCQDNGNSAYLQYLSGYTCEEQIPAALKLGALKYIAHTIENPGDIVVTVTQAGSARNQGARVSDSSNPALASGALDLWRTIGPDMI